MTSFCVQGGRGGQKGPKTCVHTNSILPKTTVLLVLRSSQWAWLMPLLIIWYVNRFSSSDRHLCNLFLQISIKGSWAEISRMIFDGREYTSVEFEGLYRAGEYREFGSMMFQVNTSLHIHQDACPDQVRVTVFFLVSFFLQWKDAILWNCEINNPRHEEWHTNRDRKLSLFLSSFLLEATWFEKNWK